MNFALFISISLKSSAIIYPADDKEALQLIGTVVGKLPLVTYLFILVWGSSWLLD